MIRRPPELAPPTADELAVIRARIDGRQPRRGLVRSLVDGALLLGEDRGLLSDYRIKLAPAPETWLGDRKTAA